MGRAQRKTGPSFPFFICVDPGTMSGWASPAGHGVAECPPEPTPGARYAKFRDLLQAIFDRRGPVSASKIVLVVEGVHGITRGMASTRVGHGLRAIAEMFAHTKGIRYVEVAPARLKKFATGNGAAEKKDMLRAARRDLGYLGSSYDEADAMHLYAMAEAGAIWD